jgi:hypothetical protein
MAKRFPHVADVTANPPAASIARRESFAIIISLVIIFVRRFPVTLTS